MTTRTMRGNLGGIDMNNETLHGIIEALGATGKREHEQYAIDLVVFLANAEGHDCDIKDMAGTAYNQEAEHLFVLRDDDGDVAWIAEINGGARVLYLPEYWADAIEDHARENDWDEKEAPDFSPVAAVHLATGISYAIGESEQVAADNAESRCDLWREIRGIN